MSQEEEFSKWLRRTEKSFGENLSFAIKAWQSAEFTLSGKYEMVLEWLTEQQNLKSGEIEESIFKDLFKLRAQPGLIAQEVKRDFVNWFLESVKKESGNARKLCNLLHCLVEFEILQDLYRMDNKILCRIYGEIFKSYENYLLSLQQREDKFLSTFESEFFAFLLKGLKEFVKRCADINLFDEAYTTFVLQPMVQVVLVFRSFKIDFFTEILDLEHLMCGEMENEKVIERFSKMYLPVKLLCIECAIVKRKGDESFLSTLLVHIFSGDINTPLSITVAAYVIEMLARHDVSLNIKVEDTSAIKLLGAHISVAVKMCKDLFLKEVLMLLCAALRLNPLILEENVFEITALIILVPKTGNHEELELFEDYLVLLMDMFRRLSRAEKFVSNLLKALKQHLQTTDFSAHKKRKSCLEMENQTPKKKRKTVDGINVSLESLDDRCKYLTILFGDFFKSKPANILSNNMQLTAATAFPKLQNYWPSNPVGLAFSKIITGLVSKPSITIWKTLLFALKDLIGSLMNTSEINEKNIFQLDFHTALLSQYFAGCKLAEQSDKFLTELQKQREFTLDVLKLFGKFLLEREHQPRVMSAFLELAYFASNFELVLTYYRPDGCVDESLQPTHVVENLHSFLATDEWTLLDQRVLNFGKSSCKHLLYRLKIQKSQASLILLTQYKADNSILNDTDILKTFLRTNQAKWYLRHLPRSDKEAVANFFINKSEFLSYASDDLELLELVAISAYEQICCHLNSKHSLLKSLSCDFDKLRHCTEVTACELLIKELIDAVIKNSEKDYKIKKLSCEEIKTSLDMLSRLPLGQLRRQNKTIIFALHLCLFRDLKIAQEDELAEKALEILKDLLHFGQQIFIFKYLPTRLLLKLLPADSCWELYKFIFSTIRNEEKGTEQFLKDLANILKESQLSSIFDDEHRKLLMAAIETLSSLNAPGAKHLQKHLNVFLIIFSDYLNKYFTNAIDGKSKRDKKFVQNTLSSFAPYALFVLTKCAKSKDNENKTETISETAVANKTADSSEPQEFHLDVDEDFRRINKIYIGHSMDYRNPHAVQLMNVSLNHRELLHLDQDEIEFVLSKYWSQINEDLNNDKVQKDICTKTLESAMKIIIGNKTNEDFLLILQTVAINLGEMQFSNVLKLLTLIAKCPFSTIKGAIFNEQYKKITVNITLRLPRDEEQQFNDVGSILKMLNCHQAVLDNKMIPISTDTIDNILSFLMDINIKKFQINDTNMTDFQKLHQSMTDVCSSLIKHRHVLLMDRVPQYMHIFKDLLQALVWYKSERQKDTALPSTEIDNLSELALKLEGLMHLIARHKVGVKRLAPFVLTFIINLMVGNKRPTTLYNKIKTHVENICYELVGICDHHVRSFILRCSNDAGRQLYEVLVKDYQKYHKFKGKV